MPQRELKELAPKIGDRKVLLLECIAPLRKKVTEAEIAAYKAEQKKVIMKFREVPVRLHSATYSRAAMVWEVLTRSHTH